MKITRTGAEIRKAQEAERKRAAAKRAATLKRDKQRVLNMIEKDRPGRLR